MSSASLSETQYHTGNQQLALVVSQRQNKVEGVELLLGWQIVGTGARRTSANESK